MLPPFIIEEIRRREEERRRRERWPRIEIPAEPPRPDGDPKVPDRDTDTDRDGEESGGIDYRIS